MLLVMRVELDLADFNTWEDYSWLVPKDLHDKFYDRNGKLRVIDIDSVQHDSNGGWMAKVVRPPASKCLRKGLFLR